MPKLFEYEGRTYFVGEHKTQVKVIRNGITYWRTMSNFSKLTRQVREAAGS